MPYFFSEVLTYVNNFYGLSYLPWEDPCKNKNIGLCGDYRLFFGFLVISSTEATDTRDTKRGRN